MKVSCCFAVKDPTGLSWPGINFDYGKRIAELSSWLQESFDDVDFVFETLTSQASDADLERAASRDGVILFLLAHGTGVGQRLVTIVNHALVVDDPFGGSGDFIRVTGIVEERELPVVTVSTMDFEAVRRRIQTYLGVPRIRSSKILVFKNFDRMAPEKEEELARSIGTGSTMKRYRAGREGFEKSVDVVREVFGVEVIVQGKAELDMYMNAVSADEASTFAEKWIEGAERVEEPSSGDITQSARMHLALQKAKEEHGADVVSVDCIFMFFAYNLATYPCLSFFEMNNSGQIGVCEGDLNAAVTHLMMQSTTGRPGFVSDPFVDTEANQIVYAHCVAPAKPLGPDSAPSPYRIRTHAEDDASAAVQVMLPPGHTVTTAKVSAENRAMSLHSGKSVGNVDVESGCRTKLAVEVPSARQIVNNWHNEIFSWHRVSVFGEHRQTMADLAKYFDLQLYEEDKV